MTMECILMGWDASTGYVGAGVAHNGSNWIAKSTSATLIEQAANSFNVYTDSGLTTGNSYTPTGDLGSTPTAPQFNDRLSVGSSWCHRRYRQDSGH